MDLSYAKNFPPTWSEEKIRQLVLDIATDPLIPWKQITGEDASMLCRCHKYIVEGMRDGKKIRVFLEPDDRGILTAYPLN